MKPFDLEEALQGKPVQLRNGNKAFIQTDLRKLGLLESITPYVIKGISVASDGADWHEYSWTANGQSLEGYIDRDSDIIGMYEEPTPTITVTLPIPFKPKVGEQYFYIGGLNSMVSEGNFNNGIFEKLAVSAGFCFRTEEDAQAWLDTMKEALNE
ncbi:pyruvate kinase [Haemophilus parahaemolyticus]|uniref:pyruvate kinase n=1 Tax=Haemophilus parahaemolyticus TaxID=735 RepID=UPI0028E281EA|nr:pyruvate kinase [Haemophilus parahaemolyticus]MDU4465705.1 pyruvate kinase [Haemophilus parahaemolyticus]